MKRQEPLWRYTTFKIGGPAEFYTQVGSTSELIKALSWAQAHGHPVFVIGWGSNILIQDGGIRGLVLRLKKEFETVEWNGPLVRAGAGVHLPRFAKMCAQHSLSGLEPLVGVPGTVGGALMSNAGTPRGEIGRLVEAVDIVDWGGQTHRLERQDVKFGYRSSNLVNRGVVTVAVLRLVPDDKNVIMRRIQSELECRSQTQPVGTHNVGSIFQNPSGDFAGRLIEAAGLKGARTGSAYFSMKHANFIVNAGGASSADVLSLIHRAQETVAKRFGIDLALEIRVVGEPA